MTKETAVLLVALSLVAAQPARAEDRSAWQRAYDPATRTRFIPVELWTGAPSDGTHEIRMAPAALEFGVRVDKSIKGPTMWNGIRPCGLRQEPFVSGADTIIDRMVGGIPNAERGLRSYFRRTRFQATSSAIS